MIFGSPVGNAVKKLETWRKQHAEIMYLTSRRRPDELAIVRKVLVDNAFPDGQLLFRHADEQYKDVAERVLPDIIVEDDCESIGGIVEMTYPHIRNDLKAKIKSVVVKDGGGIDHLPDKVEDLLRY
jgi:hypothetical protein